MGDVMQVGAFRNSARYFNDSFVVNHHVAMFKQRVTAKGAGDHRDGRYVDFFLVRAFASLLDVSGNQKAVRELPAT